MDVHLLDRLLQVRMPFGKYKDRLIADLPGNYLNWFAREGFPQGELGRLLALMHELVRASCRIRSNNRKFHKNGQFRVVSEHSHESRQAMA